MSTTFDGSTHIAFILDKSSSMLAIRAQAQDGFNEWLKGVQKDAKDVNLTLTLFNQRATTFVKNLPIKKAVPLTEESYIPDGVTALYDAIGHSVKAMQKNVNKTDRALVVILTDGQENSSHEFTRKDVFELIAKLEAKGNWTFTYLSCDPDAYADSAALGISRGNVASFVGTAAGAQSAMRNVAESTLTYASGMQGQSTSFYSSDDEPTHIAEDADHGRP